ncbi:MAG: hypothetical protein EBR28_03750 [Planctomycetia bacterium]|nr:hypothetical protein [Planctomycetia bacterium]
MISSAVGFQAVSRWHPEGPLYWLVRPRRTLRALSHGPVAVAFDAALPPSMTRWTLAPQGSGRRVVVTFHAAAEARRLLIRWRLMADVIHGLAREDLSFSFHDVLIDLGDGVAADAPPEVLAFARRPGSRARLIPNPYLLRPRPWLPPALPWGCKTDVVYFRGASTGATDYEANARVALCRVARSIPRADCRLSRIKQVDRHFALRLEEDGLVGWRLPATLMNRHRFLIDADGNSSSWDRYMLIAGFGGVPIRFETEWEESWHHLLVDGVNCVAADRHTLPEVVERLRARDREARGIAAAAGRTAAEHLSPRALRQRLAQVLSTT